MADKFSSKLKRRLEEHKVEEIAPQVAKKLQDFLSKEDRRFDELSQALILEGSGWEQHTVLQRRELESTLKSKADDCSGRLMQKLLNLKQREYENKMTEMLSGHITDLPDRLAETLREKYIELVKEYNRKMMVLLEQGFAKSNEDVFNVLRTTED